jgi:hypothetical protein
MLIIREGGDRMELLSPIILLVVAVELGFIYLRMGNLENKDTK